MAKTHTSVWFLLVLPVILAGCAASGKDKEYAIAEKIVRSAGREVNYELLRGRAMGPESGREVIPNPLYHPPLHVTWTADGYLEALTVDNFPACDIPADIAKLRHLKSFQLAGTQVTHLPPDFSRLPRLGSLIIQNTPLDSLPADFGDLQELRRLEISGTKLAALPVSFERLYGLTALEIEKTPLEVLPDGFGRLGNLTSLKLVDCRLKSLPHSFDRLSRLKTITLENTAIDQLPPGFEKLRDLKDFTFTYGMYNLANGYAEANPVLSPARINAMLAQLAACKSLKRLEINCDSLTEISAALGAMANLESLTLSGTFARLPASLAHLKKLKRLYIQSDRLAEIPDSIKNMRLEDLDITGRFSLRCYYRSGAARP